MRQRFNDRLGLVLVIASGLAWLPIPILPLLVLSGSQKLLLATTLIAIGEVMFWLGIILVGKTLAQKYRRQLNPSYWWQKYRDRQ